MAWRARITPVKRRALVRLVSRRCAATRKRSHFRLLFSLPIRRSWRGWMQRNCRSQVRRTTPEKPREAALSQYWQMMQAKRDLCKESGASQRQSSGCCRCISLIRWPFLQYIALHTSAYVSIRQHTSAYVSICQHMSAYVSIRPHTSAYVSIRQHTSAYVSIRQHSSAYVSIPATSASVSSFTDAVLTSYTGS